MFVHVIACEHLLDCVSLSSTCSSHDDLIKKSGWKLREGGFVSTESKIPTIRNQNTAVRYGSKRLLQGDAKVLTVKYHSKILE